ncbi:prepilin peptidase [Rhizobium sp. CNPSo 3464]|uniref:A24 family peptidase n=1 Tax=Rhizobium sp. CNPSo 3464 TaxID=3021406 RepID=UPI00254D0B08|nr:prepilin peptidase [Rhizobium sp. CNPSo 3464]MDK4740955.1 prepilin peptidase [Rhizobium sp. CNPSo 3464]
MLEATTLLIFPLCLAVAAFSDLFTMTIPNRVSLVLLGSFIVLAPLLGLTWPDIGMHFAGAAIVFSVCFALFALNVMGGGDAKLLAVSALWFGYDPSLLAFLVYVALIGGAVTLFILVIRSHSSAIMAMGLPLPNSLLIAKKIPYGIAIAIGGFLAFPSSPMVAAATYHII